MNHKGSKNPNAVLTPALVKEMRRLHGLGFGYTWLARWLNVSKSCVARVITGQTWVNK
jgi:hypothetical protein